MRYDAIIVGGGIVGLATAYQLSLTKPFLKIALLEKESVLLIHQSGHNSGVIHSGIYYKPGSLKATLCREGRLELLDFCNDHDLDYEMCGKVIVATNNSQLAGLEKLYERGVANGLKGLAKLSSSQVKVKEPYVNAKAGLFVPETGIVNYRSVGEALAYEASLRSTFIFKNEPLIDISVQSDGVVAITPHMELEGKMLVSCAGLQSDNVALKTMPNLDLRIVPFRGEYYKLSLKASDFVNALIYPVPDPAFPFLGVHFTRMIDGTVKAGPNAVLAFAREGYKKTDFNWNETMDTLRWPGFMRVAAKHWRMGAGEMYRSLSKDAFVRALQELIPQIEKEDLVTYTSGIRAQACCRDGKLLDDFAFIEQPRVIHVCNAPSPAATACLSIGKVIANKAMGQLL